MSFYPEKIDRRFAQLLYAGNLADADIIEQNASFVCGAVIKILLKVEGEKIVEIRFKAAGCGYLMAAADVLCEKVVAHSLKDFKDIYRRNPIQLRASIENEIGEFISTRKHCLELVIETFQTVVQNFRLLQNESWNGDDALICVCFGVSEKTIRKTIEKNNLSEVFEVTERCQAGSGCGSCQLLIQDILDDFETEKEKSFE